MNTLSTVENHDRPGFFRKLLLFFIILISLITIVSGWVSYFNPAHFWYFAIAGLGFPLLFLFNLIILILLVLAKNRMAWIPLAALLATIVHLPSLIQFGGKSEKPAYIEGQSDEIKVMSFNVRLFDLYNWTHNQETRKSIFNLLSEKQPGILCLQEFYSSARHNFDNEKSLKEILKATNSHIVYPITLNGEDHWGIATYSIYPIVNKGVLYFDKKTANICIFTDLKVESDTIRVYNCHLESVRFGDKEYKFLESFGKNEEEQTVTRTKSILGRLRGAFIKRASQADAIAKHISESPYPVLVCGDFNDTPISYTYKKVSANLIDAFRESGSGFGSSYAGPIPGLRIDYILHSNIFTSYKFQTLKYKLSDHYPLETSLVINSKK